MAKKSKISDTITADHVLELMRAIHDHCKQLSALDQDIPSSVIASLACHALIQAGHSGAERSILNFEQIEGGTMRASISGIQVGANFVNHMWGIIPSGQSHYLKAFLDYRTNNLNHPDTHSWCLEDEFSSPSPAYETWFRNDDDILAEPRYACTVWSSIMLNSTTKAAPSLAARQRRI